MVGESPAFLAAIEKVPLVARCDATVLISGETGTGKELVARAIHYLSPRAKKPFVAVNCGAIPPELVENELFGHERSAYTGATASQTGLIQEAEGGTLFLDEVDSLPLLAQVKLLRFLQEKEYRPLGAGRMLKADVRVVAAANSDLEGAVEAGRLRQDLYYRLSVIPLHLPALRERREDIPLLARHFLAKYAREMGQPARGLSPGALQTLLDHPWPGNVRELEHVIERASLLATGGEITAEDLMLRPRGDTAPRLEEMTIEQVERYLIERALAAQGGNVSEAARVLGLSRSALYRRLTSLGIRS
jgi:DNA-binding NtrC family response regulator